MTLKVDLACSGKRVVQSCLWWSAGHVPQFPAVRHPEEGSLQGAGSSLSQLQIAVCHAGADGQEHHARGNPAEIGQQGPFDLLSHRRGQALRNGSFLRVSQYLPSAQFHLLCGSVHRTTPSVFIPGQSFGILGVQNFCFGSPVAFSKHCGFAALICCKQATASKPW